MAESEILEKLDRIIDLLDELVANQGNVYADTGLDSVLNAILAEVRKK
jgi:hypothetical protein